MKDPKTEAFYIIFYAYNYVLKVSKSRGLVYIRVHLHLDQLLDNGSVIC